VALFRSVIRRNGVVGHGIASHCRPGGQYPGKNTVVVLENYVSVVLACILMVATFIEIQALAMIAFGHKMIVPKGESGSRSVAMQPFPA
jgi:hypothetical protein